MKHLVLTYTPEDAQALTALQIDDIRRVNRKFAWIAFVLVVVPVIAGVMRLFGVDWLLPLPAWAALVMMFLGLGALMTTDLFSVDSIDDDVDALRQVAELLESPSVLRYRNAVLAHRPLIVLDVTMMKQLAERDAKAEALEKARQAALSDRFTA